MPTSAVVTNTTTSKEAPLMDQFHGGHLHNFPVRGR